MTAVAGDDFLALIDAPKLTRRYWFTFALVVLQFVCEVFDFFIVGFLVSQVAPQWGLTFGESTIILLSAGFGSMLGALTFGRLSDRFGRRFAILCGTLIYCVCAGAIGLIPDGAWALFALLRFLVGFGYGGAGTSQFTLITEYTPTRYRTLMTSSLGIPASVGVLLASVVVSSLFPILGWRGVAMLGLAPVLVGIALVAVAPESMRWLVARGEAERARKSAAKMLGLPLEKVPVPTPAPPAPKASYGEVFRDQRKFWLIVTIQFGVAIAQNGVLLWGPTVLAQLLNITAQQAATYFIGVSLTGVAGRIFFTVASQKIGRLKSGYLLAYIGAAGLAGASIFHGQYVAGLPLFFIFLTVGFFFLDGGYANFSPYAAELYPVRLAATALGVQQAASGLGKIIGPLVLGLMAGASNLVTPKATQAAVAPAFMFLACGCLAAGLAYSFLGIETHKRALKLA